MTHDDNTLVAVLKEQVRVAKYLTWFKGALCAGQPEIEYAKNLERQWVAILERFEQLIGTRTHNDAQ